MKRLILIAALMAAAVSLSCGGRGEKPRGTLLQEKDRQYVRSTLEGMTGDVRLVLFSAEKDCQYCGDAEVLLGDIAGLDSRVSLEVLSLKKDAARARALGIDKAPGIAILGAKDYGLRYFGLPSGHEFMPFVETVRDAGKGVPLLAPATVAALAALTKPVTITVFVTQH